MPFCPQKTLHPGFTLIEMLLATALVTAIAAVGIPEYRSFQLQNDLTITVDTIAQNARRAQLRAIASEGDSNWGVNVESTTITLFKGFTYAARSSTYDEISTISSALTVTGTTEFSFNKFTGTLTSSITTTLTTLNNQTRVITINQKGIADY